MSVGHSTEKPSISDRLQSFLSKNHVAIWIFIAAAFVLVVGGVVYSQVVRNRSIALAEASEALDDLYERWLGAYRNERNAQGDAFQASAETAALESELRQLIATTVATHARTAAATRARHTLGGLEWELGNFAEAREAFLAAATDASSHLAPIAVFNAAAAAEQLGNVDEAVSGYTQVVEWPSAALEKPRALFNLGRLNEARGDTAAAISTYERLVDEYPGTSWTNLGRNRIIWLNSRSSTSAGS